MSEIPSSPEGEPVFRPALDLNELVEARHTFPNSMVDTSSTPPTDDEKAALQAWQERHQEAFDQLNDNEKRGAYSGALLRLRVRVRREYNAWYAQNKQALSSLSRKQRVAACDDAIDQLTIQGVPDDIMPEAKPDTETGKPS